MRTGSLPLEYIRRLMRKTWAWGSGVISVIALIVDIFFAGQFPWILYPLIFGIGLIIASYQVFADLVREQESKDKERVREINGLRERIRDLEEKQPRIVVGFQDNGDLVHRLVFNLKPLSPEPDYDALVEQKRQELLTKAEKHERRLRASSGLVIIYSKNPNYEKEIEEYLLEYRSYLKRRRDYAIRKDRLRFVRPVVENRGRYPADDVTLEFVLPRDLQIATREQLLWLLDDDLEPLPPEEPKLFTSLLEGLNLSILSPGLIRPPASPPPQPPSNIEGPSYEDKNGVTQVVYTVKRLVQSRPERDFRPFPLWFGDIHRTGVWEVPIKIYAANLAEPESDSLFLEIRILENVDSSLEQG